MRQTKKAAKVKIDHKMEVLMQMILRESFSLFLTCGFPREAQRVKVRKNADGSYHATLPVSVVRAVIKLPKEKAIHLSGCMLKKWKQKNNRRCIRLENEWADIASITHANTILMSVYSRECRRLLRLKEFACGKKESLRKLCKE